MSKTIQRENSLLLFDPRSSGFRANPYPAYHYLRTHHPIYYRRDRKDWILTRYADIHTVLNSSQFGRPEKKTIQPQSKAEVLLPHFLQLRQDSQNLMRLWLLLLNPPDHTRIRRILQSAFTASKIQALRSYIQASVDSLIESTLSTGEMDVVCDFAHPLTLDLNCKLLGIPPYSQFSQWTRGLSLITDMDVTPVAREQGLLAISGLVEHLRALIVQVRCEPSSPDGLLRTLADSADRGELSEDELLSNAIFMFATGHSTTEYLISNSVLALLNHPAQLHRLRANPQLISSAIDEVLRYDSPAQSTSYIALSDVEINRQIVRRGERVHCILAAANRDPEQFSNPNEFDIGRKPNTHLSFGRGTHACIGKHLAKMVSEIAVLAIVTKLPQINLKLKTLEWGEPFMTRGLKSLLVSF
ncbi:MAG: cytochrome P450 [Phormidesmis sp.]